jgi:MFS superfamily sulfate permease-like transporter
MRLGLAPTMDVTAAIALQDLHRDLAARGVRLVLCRVSPHEFALLERMHVVERFGRENFFPDAEAAVAAVARDLGRQAA